MALTNGPAPRHLTIVLVIAPAVALAAFLAGHEAAEPGSDRASADRASSPVRAVEAGNRVIPLYPASDSDGGEVTYVGFERTGRSVTAVDQDGGRLWRVPAPGKRPFGGFDYDQDGWPDAAVVDARPTARQCGGGKLFSRSLLFYSGRTGAETAPLSPLTDYCHANGTAVQRWSGLAPLFGSGPGLAFAPQYHDQGWLLRFSEGGWHEDGRLYQPTGPWWDSAYGLRPPKVDCRHRPTEPGCIEPHAFNGLITTVEGEERLVAWTTGQVMQFRLGEPLGPSQLAASHAYISHCQPPVRVCGPRHVAGRNYGLVTRDAESGKIALLAGTSAFSVFSDMKAGYSPSPDGDPYGQFERHVSIYDPSVTDEVDDRPYGFSTANTPDWRQYWGRLVYPANPLVSTGLGASRLAYNVYSDLGEEFGHWYMQVSKPGSTEVQAKIRDRFLWDIRDVDGDGTDEWVTSPVQDRGPSSYLPRHRIELLHWDEDADRLTDKRMLDGVYPYLTRSFRTPETSTSQTFLFPVLSVKTTEGLRMLVTEDGTDARPAP